MVALVSGDVFGPLQFNNDRFCADIAIPIFWPEPIHDWSTGQPITFLLLLVQACCSVAITSH